MARKKKEFPIDEALSIVQREVSKTGNPPVEKYNGDPFRTLIGCIVSLRTQDKTTAAVNDRLFSRVHSIEDLIEIPEDELAKLLYPAGFYRQKARQIKQLVKMLKDEFNGKIPSDIDSLLKLPGVGRKTANLTRTVGFGLPGICVDTHVHRITNRWEYVNTKTPDETEMELRKKLPKEWWIEINRILVLWGQQRCKPRYPLCDDCPLAKMCPYPAKAKKDSKSKPKSKKSRT